MSESEEKVESGNVHVSPEEDTDDGKESVEETVEKDTPVSGAETGQGGEEVASSRDIEPPKEPARKAPPPPPRDTDPWTNCGFGQTCSRSRG